MSECTSCRTDKGYLCACETDEVRARLDLIRQCAADDEDVDLAAHARQDVPWLLDRIQALEQRIECRRLQVAGALLLDAEACHEDLVKEAASLAEAVALKKQLALTPGEKLMIQAGAVRKAAEEVVTGEARVRLHRHADHLEAEAKGGV